MVNDIEEADGECECENRKEWIGYHNKLRIKN